MTICLFVILPAVAAGVIMSGSGLSLALFALAWANILRIRRNYLAHLATQAE